jgi:hypothetical protein
MIKGVAIYFENYVWSLPLPHKHYEVINLICAHTPVMAFSTLNALEDGLGQGFTDGKCMFVSPQKAWIIAKEFDQIIDEENPTVRVGCLHYKDLKKS